MSTGNIPRPGRYPYHAENITVSLPTVSEGSGYTPSTIADSDVANAIGQSAGRWIQQMDLARMAVDDWIDRNVPYLVRGQSLQYPTGVGISNLTPDQTPTVIGAGCRISFDETVLSVHGLNPITFTPSRRTWFYGLPPVAPGEYPIVRAETVTLGAAPAPIGMEAVLGGVDTDATQVTANLASTLGETPTIDIPIEFGGLVTIDGSDTVLDVTGGGSEGGDAAVKIDGGLGPALEVTSTSPTDSAITANATQATAVVGETAGGTFYGISGTNSAAGGAGVGGIATSSGPGVLGTSTSGSGVRGLGGGSGDGITGIGGTTGVGVAGTGGSTSGHGVTGISQGPNSDGIRGTGANQSTSHGVKGIAANTSAYGVYGTTAAGATTSAAGVRAEAFGDGDAISAVAINGNAARLESDISSPSRAPLLIVPQDADASTTQVGSIAVNSSRLNKIRHNDGSNYLSVHSSRNGFVDEFAEALDGSGVNSGNLATVTITPEVVGTVLVEASGVFSMGAATDNFNFVLVDVTTGTPIRSVQIDIGVANEARAQSLRAVYTLPSAASRQIAFQINGNGASSVTRSACVLNVRGIG